MQIQFVKISGNGKIGKISCTTTESKSCPKSCPFRFKACYAGAGYYTKLNWDKLDAGERGSDWDTVCDNVRSIKPGAVWRHNVAGDLPHFNEVIDFPKTQKLVLANTGKKGFTFSHHDMKIAGNRFAVKYANDNGFTVNLSANGMTHADELADLKIGPVAVTMPSDFDQKVSYTAKGRKAIICPATYKDDVTCGSCGLCAKSDRHVMIVFPAHGKGAKLVNEIIAKIEADYASKRPQRDAKGRFVKGNIAHTGMIRDAKGRFSGADI